MSSSISLQSSNKKAIIDVINGCLKVMDATCVWGFKPEHVRRHWKEVRKIELTNLEAKSKKQLLYIANSLKASLIGSLRSIDKLGAIGRDLTITSVNKYQ